MDSVSYLIVVLYFSGNIWAQLQPSNQHFQNLQRIITIKPSSVAKKSITSDYNLLTNAEPPVPSTETLINLPEFSEHGNKEVHENVRAIILTKRVPVPYTVHVEKKVPYPVKVPIRRPFTVYVPKPYVVEFPKPYPFAIKVPMPQPYTVEKHIPFPVRIPIDKPYPVHINKPYPVFIEKKVPFPVEKHIPVQIKIPVERPYPVHIPVEKPVPYPVEKHIPIPVKFPVDRPVPVPIEKPIPITIEQATVIEKPQTTELLADNNQLSSNEYSATIRTPVSNFQPSSYDPIASSIITQENNKPISFLPGTIQQSYTLGPIHVPEKVQSQNWNTTTTDWIPKQQYGYAKPEKTLNFLPKTLKSYKYVLPEQVTSALNMENIETFSNSPTLKETHGMQYEPVKYEPLKQEIAKSTQQNQQLHLQQQNMQQQQQETINNYQAKVSQLQSNPLLQSTYQFFNIHPQIKTQETKPANSQAPSISYQKVESIQHPEMDTTKWMPHTLLYNKPQMQYLTQQQQVDNQQKDKVQYEEIPRYMYQISHLIEPDNGEHKYQAQYTTGEIMNFIPTAQAVYLAQPTYQETMPSKINIEQNYHQSQQQSTTDYQTKKAIKSMPELKIQYKREESPPQHQTQQFSPPIIVEAIEYQHHFDKPINTLAMPQTNSHAGFVEPTTTTSQQSIPATTELIESTSSNSSANLPRIPYNSTEISKKNDDVNNLGNIQKQNHLNIIENTPINYSDINRTFVRKIRRKNLNGKRKHYNKETMQTTLATSVS